MNEPPSGASRMVAGPLMRMVQSFGAMKGLPRTVVLGVSAERRSGAGWASSVDDRAARIARVRMRASFFHLLSAMPGEQRHRLKIVFLGRRRKGMAAPMRQHREMPRVTLLPPTMDCAKVERKD